MLVLIRGCWHLFSEFELLLGLVSIVLRVIFQRSKIRLPKNKRNNVLTENEPRTGPISQNDLRLRGPTLLDRGVKNLSRDKYETNVCTYFWSFESPSSKVWDQGKRKSIF